jgi:pimeloyl-ACP methyl ester carboxylesterase
MSPTLRLGALIFSILPACLAGPEDSDPSCTGGKCDGSFDEGNLAIAADLPAHCDSPELMRIARPVASDGLVRGVYGYGFRFKAPATPEAPVIVFLPGGPGSSSTEAPPEFVPPDWGYLMTDPRGVGCNRLAETPTGEVAGAYFRTQEIARDVVAAIRDRKLTNYVVFGISYGTLLGTTVAHDLARDPSIPAPRAVVLEGVLGHAFENFVGAAYISQWDRVRGLLPADVIARLDRDEAPYGIDATSWSRALMSMLPRGPLEVANILTGLSTTQPAATQEEMLGLVKLFGSADPTPPGAQELYRQITCRELVDTTPATNLDVVFAGGRLVRNTPEEGTTCGELRITTPYDSATLPFETKLYYFLGDSDPATPIDQGNYHFEHHEGPAVRVVTIDGGHNPLQYNQADCAPSLMASIAAGGADLATLAAACPMPTRIDSK